MRQYDNQLTYSAAIYYESNGFHTISRSTKLSQVQLIARWRFETRKSPAGHHQHPNPKPSSAMSTCWLDEEQQSARLSQSILSVPK
ncbi:hypothetical protein Nepgr_001050 [Nepenthes gracilis]|uniref:Uncharacterized protein n=1 Tax=Nepenthes gracilis TaxID=150966 RepID=A0AAD3RX23_NEPGR|nr:hypothetical protein Nepgr_001050 [Nepenthes gracilis]